VSEPNKLEELLAHLPDSRAPAGWQDRVRAAIAAGTPVSDIRPQPSRRPLWIAGGSALAVAVAIAIYVVTRDPVAYDPVADVVIYPTPTQANNGPSPPAIAVKVQAHEPMAGALAASVGDTVVITAERADELRVYRAGALIARCPGDAGCHMGAGHVELSHVVTARGALSAIAFRPALPAEPPASPPASLDADLARAAEVRSQMVLSASIEVQ